MGCRVSPHAGSVSGLRRSSGFACYIARIGAARLHPGYERLKISYPRPKNLTYTSRIRAGLRVAVMTRSGSQQGAGLRQRDPRWSAGRRSVSVAGLANPPHEARAPQDGIRNPILQARSVSGVTHRAPQGVSQTPGASRRSISLLRKGEGNRERVYPHPDEWAAERWLKIARDAVLFPVAVARRFRPFRAAGFLRLSCAALSRAARRSAASASARSAAGGSFFRGSAMRQKASQTGAASSG